jgi:hypothetical protein
VEWNPVELVSQPVVREERPSGHLRHDL